MVMKLFILGRPGCGKSTAARHIAMLARDNGWSAIHFNDYEILHKMFRNDIGSKKFRPMAYGGFDVTDPTVLHEALKELAGRVQEFTFSLEKERLVIIEFARSDILLVIDHQDVVLAFVRY